jgi:hypothetical protein
VGVYFKKNGQWVGPVFLYRSYYFLPAFGPVLYFHLCSLSSIFCCLCATVPSCTPSPLSHSHSPLPSPLSSSICRWTKHVSLQWAQQGMRITCRMLLSLSAHKTNTRELHQQAVALFDAARSVGSTENHQIHQQADTRPDEGAWGCRPVGGWPEELATRAQHNDELLCSAHYRGHAGTANVRTQHGPALSITTAGRPRSSASSGIFFKIIRSSPSARPIRHPDMVRDVRPSSISGPPY